MGVFCQCNFQAEFHYTSRLLRSCCVTSVLPLSLAELWRLQPIRGVGPSMMRRQHSSTTVPIGQEMHFARFLYLDLNVEDLNVESVFRHPLARL